MKLSFSLLLLLIVCSLWPSLGMAQDNLRVEDVRVEGERFVAEDRILLEFGVIAGDPLDREKVAEGVKRLTDSKRFESVDLRAEMVGESGIILILDVVEYPRVSELNWNGNDKIKDEDLAEAVSVSVGGYLRPYTVEQDRETIEKLYEEKGYHSVTVDPQLAVEDGRATLTFAIKEGKKAKIKRVQFEGNDQIDASHLRSALRSKPLKFYNPLSWTHFNDLHADSVLTDVSRLTQLYHQEGYLDAKILESRKDFSEDQESVELTYVIEEGPLYYFGELSWSGNEKLTDFYIESRRPFVAGEPFNGYLLDEFLGVLTNQLYDQGYLYNRIQPARTIQETRVDLDFQIWEGPPASVREVVITGNDKTLDRVIRREIKIYPGELFNRDKLARSHRDVFMLRYFDDVQVEPRTDPASGAVDLNFHVLERPTGNFGAGVTYSEATGMTGFLQVGATNFRGRGQTLNAQWEFGRRVHLFNISFVEPWAFNRPVTASASIYRSRSNLYGEFYKDEKLGFSFGLGRPFPWVDHSRVSAAYRFEIVDLFDFSPEYIAQGGQLATRNWPEVESSVTLTFLRNSTDSPFLPSRGTRFSVSGQFAGGLLGGSLYYQKYLARYTWYNKIFGPWVLRYHQTFGLVDGIDSADQVPDQERFRLGGNRIYPVRGYSDYSIVPAGNSVFLGGRSMTTGTVEAVIGVSNSVQIILPFFDFGGTWNSLADTDLTTLRRSVGMGIRVEVPMMGVMGLDWGYPLDPVGADKGRLHFKMGTDF